MEIKKQGAHLYAGPCRRAIGALLMEGAAEVVMRGA